MKSDAITLRVEHETLALATELFNELGLTISSAFTMFLKKSIHENGIPFSLHLNRPLSDETMTRIYSADDDSVSFSNVNDLKKAIHDYVRSDQV